MLSISPTFKQKKIKKRSIILRNLGILIKLQYVFVFTILKEKKIQKKKKRCTNEALFYSCAPGKKNVFLIGRTDTLANLK